MYQMLHLVHCRASTVDPPKRRMPDEASGQKKELISPEEED